MAAGPADRGGSRPGIVLEVRRGHAVVLSDGRFVRLPSAAGWEVGEEVWVPPPHASAWRARTWTAVAAGTAVAVTAGTLLWSSLAAAQTVAVVSVDLNPSVQFGVNAGGRVTSATAETTDGNRLLQGVHWQGQPVQQAITTVVRRAVADGYVASSTGGSPVTSGAAKNTTGSSSRGNGSGSQSGTGRSGAASQTSSGARSNTSSRTSSGTSSRTSGNTSGGTGSDTGNRTGTGGTGPTASPTLPASLVVAAVPQGQSLLSKGLQEDLQSVGSQVQKILDGQQVFVYQFPGDAGGGAKDDHVSIGTYGGSQPTAKTGGKSGRSTPSSEGAGESTTQSGARGPTIPLADIPVLQEICLTQSSKTCREATQEAQHGATPQTLEQQLSPRARGESDKHKSHGKGQQSTSQTAKAGDGLGVAGLTNPAGMGGVATGRAGLVVPTGPFSGQKGPAPSTSGADTSQNHASNEQSATAGTNTPPVTVTVYGPSSTQTADPASGQLAHTRQGQGNGSGQAGGASVSGSPLPQQGQGRVLQDQRTQTSSPSGSPEQQAGSHGQAQQSSHPVHSQGRGSQQGQRQGQEPSDQGAGWFQQFAQLLHLYGGGASTAQPSEGHAPRGESGNRLAGGTPARNS